VFLGASTVGIAQGAAVGLVVGVLGFAVVGTTLLSGGLMIGIPMILGAVGRGIYSGQKNLEEFLSNPTHTVGDRIAETSRAVQTPAQFKPVAQAFDANLNNEADAILQANADTVSRVQAEADRRARKAEREVGQGRKSTER
jgi:hypothetical protein